MTEIQLPNGTLMMATMGEAAEIVAMAEEVGIRLSVRIIHTFLFI